MRCEWRREHARGGARAADWVPQTVSLSVRLIGYPLRFRKQVLGARLFRRDVLQGP